MVRTLPTAGGRAALPVRHGQRRALRRDRVRHHRGTRDGSRCSRPSPGEPPYPEVMNRGAIAEIGRHRPGGGGREGRPHRRRARTTSTRRSDVLRRRRSATASTRAGQPRRLPRRRRSPIGADREVELPGVRAARCSTPSIPFETTGRVTPDAARVARRSRGDAATGPSWCSATTTLWSPDSRSAAPTYFGINPDDSDGLVDVVAAATRHPSATSPGTPIATASATSAPPARAVGRGGVREGLPGHVGRVPRLRGRHPPGAPSHLDARSAGVDRTRPGRCSPASTRLRVR